MRLFLIFASLICLIFTPLSAGSVPGEDEDAYQRAFALWINNDDATSIPLFSDLAENGNAAAKILLTQIDKSPELWGPWVAGLTREQRLELFRKPGGLSGISWMKTIPEVPLAKAWLEARDVDMTTKTAMDFVDMGEPRAARTALVYLDARQGSGFASLANDPRYPPSLRFLIWQEWQRNGVEAERISQELSELAAGDPQRTMMGEKTNDQAFENWLMTSPQTQPLVAACLSYCSESVTSCVRAAYLGIGDYRVLTMLETDEGWINSPRGEATLFRVINLTRGTNSPDQSREKMSRIKSVDACFADVLNKEAARF